MGFVLPWCEDAPVLGFFVRRRPVRQQLQAGPSDEGDHEGAIRRRLDGFDDQGRFEHLIKQSIPQAGCARIRIEVIG